MDAPDKLLIRNRTHQTYVRDKTQDNLPNKKKMFKKKSPLQRPYIPALNGGALRLHLVKWDGTNIEQVRAAMQLAYDRAPYTNLVLPA